MNEPSEKFDAGPAVMEVDRLLREYYRAEMPDPWPSCKRPVGRLAHARRSAHPWLRTFAVAASVVVAFFGYWTLDGIFPQPNANTGVLQGPEVSENPLHHRPPQKHLAPIEHQRTPAGSDAQLFEEGTPNGPGVITIIGPSNNKGMR